MFFIFNAQDLHFKFMVKMGVFFIFLLRSNCSNRNNLHGVDGPWHMLDTNILLIESSQFEENSTTMRCKNETINNDQQSGIGGKIT